MRIGGSAAAHRVLLCLSVDRMPPPAWLVLFKGAPAIDHIPFSTVQ